MIDVTIERKQEQMDLRIPTNFMLLEIKELVAQIFREQGKPLADDWIMRLKNKRINLSEYDYLEEFPIGNGDIFEIIEWENDEII